MLTTFEESLDIQPLEIDGTIPNLNGAVMY